MMSGFCRSLKTFLVATILIAASLPLDGVGRSRLLPSVDVMGRRWDYDSQYPGSHDMNTISFKEAFEKNGFLYMATVNLVPFGNTREREDADGMYHFYTQHGYPEYVYNAIEAALDKIKSHIMPLTSTAMSLVGYAIQIQLTRSIRAQ